MGSLEQRVEALQPGSTLAYEELVQLTADILVHAGVPAPDAKLAGKLLAEAHRRGIDSHGIAHLPVYIRRLATGAIAATAAPKLQRTGPATAVMDARNALGVLVASAAMDEACRSACEFGVGACAVRDSNHFGAAAPIVERAAINGFIALALSNAAPTMAPWGGRVAVLGTNPLAAAFPCTGNAPIIIDMATAAASRGRIRQAELKNEALPSDWALDEYGRPTTDPKAALRGTVQPLGGAKGYALTVIIELLCTCLSGGRPGFEVRNPHDRSPEPAGASHLFIALDPRMFAGLGIAEDAITRLGARIEGSEPANRDSPRLPGARAARTAALRDRAGIPMTDNLVAQLREAVRELSAGWPA